ncbi:MAG: HAD-IIB family hydrolase [Candidatus Dormibacteria bacterium]
MSGIRLVAVDLDGTVVDENLVVDPEDLLAAGRLAAAGVRLVVATGRLFGSALPYARQLGANGPVICCQGALVRDAATGEVLERRWVEPDSVSLVAAICRRERFHLNAYDADDVVLVERDRPGARIYCRIARREFRVVPDLGAALPEGAPKLVVIGSPSELPELGRLIEVEARGRLSSTTSLPYFLEITAHGVSKGSALAALAARLGLEAREVAAVGDGLNDLEMVEWAGLGLAMPGCPLPLEAAADQMVPPGRPALEFLSGLLGHLAGD